MRRAPGAAMLAASVVGVGALLLPGLAAQTAGPAALLAWLCHLVLGAALVVTLAAAARAGDFDGVAGLAAAAFGTAWRRALLAMYVAGVTVGQAVVAMVAGAYAATLAGGAGAVALPAAWAALALAVWTALAGMQVGPAARLAILGGIALALAAAALATPLRPDGRLVGAAFAGGLRPAGQAAFLMLFAFVGWETALALRGRALGVALGVALVALLYGVAALTAQSARVAAGSVTGSRLPLLPATRADWVARLVALVAVPACVVACGRNVRAAAALARRLAHERVLPAWAADERRATVAVGAGAAAGLALLGAGWADVPHLLAVPNSMALAIYATAAAASFALLRGGRRWLAVAPLGGCLLLAFFAGAAALLPVAVGTAAWAAGRRSAPHRAPSHQRGNP